MSDRTTETGRLFNRCFLLGFCGSRWAVYGSAIDEVVTEVQRRVAAVEGPARLLRAAGILVALTVVAAAGAFAMAARRVESSLLFARGARPATVGARAVLEAAIPSLLGVVAGLAVAFVARRRGGTRRADRLGRDERGPSSRWGHLGGQRGRDRHRVGRRLPPSVGAPPEPLPRPGRAPVGDPGDRRIHPRPRPPAGWRCRRRRRGARRRDAEHAPARVPDPVPRRHRGPVCPHHRRRPPVVPSPERAPPRRRLPGRAPAVGAAGPDARS